MTTHRATTTATAAPARTSRRKRVAVIGAAGVLMLGGGVAWAAWTTGGTGTANAQATTATALTVSGGSPVGVLYPKPAGGYPTTAVGSIYTTVTNPNSYPVTITHVTVGTITISPLAGRTCAAGSVVSSTAGPLALTTPIALAANSSPTAITIPGAIEMIAAAEDGCQGASFTVPITVTAA